MNAITRAEALVLETVRQLAVDFEIPALSEPTSQSFLYGEGGALDSMALVNLLADLEAAVEVEFKQSIVLADERALSAGRSPFRTVESVATAIVERLET